MATRITSSFLPGTTLPPITEFPIDGSGGSYYDIQFSVPVYNRGELYISDSVSWRDIDRYGRYSVISAVESTVAFSLCITTLLNVVVLTPIPKRRLPIHTILCLALVFQIVRNVADISLLTDYLPSSAYCYLTYDVGATMLSASNRSLIIVGNVSASISLILVQACFFIQSRAILTWLRLHHHRVYLVLLSCLVIGGIVATAFRIGLAIIQIIDLREFIRGTQFRFMLYGTLITYGISITSWSLVFLVSTVAMILNRRNLLFQGMSVYDAALRVVAMIFLESFIVPIMFCIMEIFKIGPLKKPEQLVIPVVLFLLPLGGLFLTAHENANTTHPQDGKSAVPAYKQVGHGHNKESATKSSQLAGRPSFVTFSEGSAIENSTSASHLNSQSKAGDRQPGRFTDQIELELAMIDAVDEEKSL